METEGVVTPNQAGPPFSNPLGVGDPIPVPLMDISPPSYADIAHKKSTVSSGSSNEESIEFSKKRVLQKDWQKV